MKKIGLLGTSALRSAALGLSVGVAAPGLAHAAPDSQPTVASAEPDERQANADGTPIEDGELIQVTGSRLRRPNLDALEPTVVLDSEYLETFNFTNVGEALADLPGFGVPFNPNFNQQNYIVGSNYLNKFSLGPARTLTLLNGRRFVPTNAPVANGGPPAGLYVDQNVFPTLLIDRIDSIAIGGAAAYGSDAIAGAVNVILKTDFEGLRISAKSGISQRGDNPRYNVAALAGLNTRDGRGNVTLNLNYDQVVGALAITREPYQGRRYISIISSNTGCGAGPDLLPGRPRYDDGRVYTNVPCNGSTTIPPGSPPGYVPPGLTDGAPLFIAIREPRNPSGTVGGLLLPATGAVGDAFGVPLGFGPGNTRLQFAPDGSLISFNPGIPFGLLGAPGSLAGVASGGDGFNSATTAPLTSDLTRYTGFMTANYKLTDNIRVFFEGSLYRSEARELLDTPILNTVGQGGASAPLIFSATDPRLVPQARAQLAALGVTNFRLSRYHRDIATQAASSRQDVRRAVFGVDGDFSLGGYKFFWEASANFGRTQGNFYATTIDQQRFVNAINVTTANGQIVCNTNVTTHNANAPIPGMNVAPGGLMPVVDPGCVPLDIFGAGRPSAAAVAYVTQKLRGKTNLKQTTYNLNVSGNLFDFWGAGPIGMAAGYEHRYEYAGFFPDPYLSVARGRNSVAVPLDGSFNTDEVFGELLVPLVSPANDIPFIYAAQLEAKARYVHNVVNGGFWAYTLGGRFAPVKGVQFRGNYTRSLRAPTLTELFTPQSTVRNIFNDPCDATQIGLGQQAANRAKNCAAFFQSYGITAPFTSNARTTPVDQLQGGNPNLGNEQGRAYTFGVVLQPAFLPGFTAAIDWNRVRITDTLVPPNQQSVAEGCYDSLDFDASDVDNANPFCSAIKRMRTSDPLTNGQLVNTPGVPALNLIYLNGAFQEFAGLTAEVKYNTSLSRIGWSGAQLNLGLYYFYTHRGLLSRNGVFVNDDRGEINQPLHTAQATAGLTIDNFSLNLIANYTGSWLIDNTWTVEQSDVLGGDPYTVFNGTIGWKLKKGTAFRITVNNIFDKAVPSPWSGFGTSVYDYIGRRFMFSVDHEF